MNGASINRDRDGGDDRHSRRRERTRGALLDAARHEFARLGYTATTVADITRAADVGVGTFYLHFRDKDVLLRTLIEEGLLSLKTEVAEAVMPLPLNHSLPTAVRAICAASYANRDLFRIAYSAGNCIDLVMYAQDLLAEYLTQAIQEAAHLGDIDATLDPPLIARLITGMISQGTLWWTQHATPAPDKMAAQILRLLRTGLPATLLEE